MSYKSEFPPDFTVPPEILAHPDIVDTSWHNDISPSFTLKHYERKNDLPIGVLWVNHPDPTLRELPAKRFVVCDVNGKDILETDDAKEALQALENIKPA